MTILIVTAADEHYFPLAKGLVLSLRAGGIPDDTFRLGFIDIGCAAASLAWLADQGVAVVRLGDDVAGQFDLTGVPSFHQALVCRPLLPDIFPGHDGIIWLDSDCWVQERRPLDIFGELIRADRERLFVCPECHYSYLRLHYHFGRIDWLRTQYSACFGAAMGERLALMPMLNSGVFAMASASPVWHTWAEALKAVYRQRLADGGVAPIPDQLALNYAAALRDCTVPVDPLYNYMCLFAYPVRAPNSDTLRVGLPPNQAIGIVHLAGWSTEKTRYLRDELLYDRGAYLTDAERAQLLT